MLQNKLTMLYLTKSCTFVCRNHLADDFVGLIIYLTPVFFLTLFQLSTGGQFTGPSFLEDTDNSVG